MSTIKLKTTKNVNNNTTVTGTTTITATSHFVSIFGILFVPEADYITSVPFPSRQLWLTTSFNVIQDDIYVIY